jgi:hypothetical protein
MPPGTSGLERDLNLVRRRAWLFIPFAVLGILAALFVGRATGDSNAVASMTLDTTVHDLIDGGDRGLRIFEAQEMTSDPNFIEKVKAAIGDPDFEYTRFAVSLSPISVGDGISRGILTVSITDPDKAQAERYRQAFVDVFTQEYTSPEGLFRTRFVDRRRKTAEDNDAQFQAAYQKLEAALEPLGIHPAVLLETRGTVASSLPSFEEQAALERQIAEIDGALSTMGSASAAAGAAVASSILGQAVAPGDAQATLTLRKASLEAALETLRTTSPAVAETLLEPETLQLLDEARGQRAVKDASYIRLANAQVAVDSAESRVLTSYSSSGGLAGSTLGRVAVAIAITIVFGLIAIYTLEWLSQARSSSET